MRRLISHRGWIAGCWGLIFARCSYRRGNAGVYDPPLLATVSNGWTGYWPTRAAFDDGGYEINASWACKPGDGEWLIDELVGLAESIT